MNQTDPQVIGRVFAPVNLLVSPIGVIFFVYIALINEKKEALPSLLFLIVVFALFFGFWMSFWYCKTRMDWFQKKYKSWAYLGIVSGPLLSLVVAFILHRESLSGRIIPIESKIFFVAMFLLCFKLSRSVYRASKLNGIF